MNTILIVKQNLQLVLLIAVSIVAGIVQPNLGVAVSLGVLIILGFKSRYVELVIVLLLMLLLSDSRQESLEFFQTAKKIGMVLFGLIVWFAARNYQLDKNVVFMLFTPFLIWSTYVALAESPEVVTSIQKTLSYGILFFAVPIVIQILIKTDLDRFLRMLIVFIFCYLSLGIVAYVLGFDIAQLAGRYRGLMGNPNGLGIVTFLFTILFDSIRTKYPDLLSRRMTILMWFLLLSNLVLCGSRSALAALLIYWLFRSFKILKGFMGVLFFALSLLVYQSIIALLPQIIDALNLGDYLRIETLESGSGRLVAWQFAWSQIQESFFVGRGFHYTELLFSDNYRALSRLGHQGNAHNSFLTFWLDTGLIGLILYMSGFFLLFFRIAKTNLHAQAIMYAILFSLTFESWLTASLNPMTITLLIILSILLYGKSNVDESKISGQTA